MKYDFENFSPEHDVDRIKNAEQRRATGKKMLEEMSRVKMGWGNTFDVCKSQGMNPKKVLRKYINTSPEGIAAASDYVRSRGLVPSFDLDELAMQYANVRSEHVNEYMDRYDMDNFESYEGNDYEGSEYEGDAADNLFGRTGKRYRSKHGGKSRKEVRQERKAKRKAANGDDVIADQTAETPGTIPDNQVLPQPQMDMQTADNSPMPQPVFTQAAPPLELQSPDAETAEAEILGEESEFEDYEGEHESLLPVLKALEFLGNENFECFRGDNATGAPSVDWGGLFNSLSQAGADIVNTVKNVKAAKKIGAKMPVKDIVSNVKAGVTEKEKNKYLKDHTPEIILGVGGALVVMYLLFSSK